MLTRAAMQLFGYPMTFECFDVDDNLPIVQFAKCREAVIFNLFAKDASVKLKLSTPDGVPAFDNTEFIIEDSVGDYPLSRWIHTDCRVFIKQKNRSKICVKKDFVEDLHINVDERITITGLDDAELTIYPTKGGIAWVAPQWGAYYGPKQEAVYDAQRGCYIVSHVSGFTAVMWQEKENFGDYRMLEFLRTPDQLPDENWKFEK